MYIIIVLFICLRFIYRRVRESEHKQEGQRGRENLRQTLHWTEIPTQGPISPRWDHKLSQTKSWTLTQPSHPGVPLRTFIPLYSPYQVHILFSLKFNGGFCHETFSPSCYRTFPFQILSILRFSSFLKFHKSVHYFHSSTPSSLFQSGFVQ